MRNPFRRDPTAAITTGVNELLRRFPQSHGHDALFWRMHGSEKLRLWLSIADRFQTPTPSDVQAIAQFKLELTMVAEALEAVHFGQEDLRSPDFIRSLVFSNCITYDAERRFRSPTEMWETYVRVLQVRHLAPRVAERQVSERNVTRQRLTALQSGKALSTALVAMGSAAEDWRRVTSASPQARDRDEFVEKWRPAFAAPAKVDADLAGLVVGFPPDEYMDLYEAFVLAVNALLGKWQADLAAVSLLWAGRNDEANTKIAEAERSKVEFYRFWRLFQETFRAMERDDPRLIASLQLSAYARTIAEKQDWFVD